MDMDLYPDFKTLTAHEVLNRDYRIRILNRGADTTIMAPHGGRIEPGTSTIAGLIAGDMYNCYCFEGLKTENNRTLHIASHRFDEPGALRLAAHSERVVTVHACRDREKIVFVGGRCSKLAGAIRTRLVAAGIASRSDARFPGVHPRNICNLGKRGMGVQLEISRGVRDDPDACQRLCRAVREVLQT